MVMIVRNTVVLTLMLTLLLHPWTARAYAADVWPLVKFADGAVWGTLMAVDTVGDDRILLIAVDGSTPSPFLRGNGSISLLERAGRHPDGTPLVPGSSGLFLFTDVDTPASTDGYLIAGAFLPVESILDRDRIQQLVTAEIVGENVSLETAGNLLRSEQAACRLFATRCFQQLALDRSASLDAGLRQAFRTETSTPVLVALLDLFLVRGWPLVDGSASNLVLSYESSELNELALAYVARHGDADDRAQLLTAYPEANVTTRRRLLTAYARLGLREAEPWWHHALTCEDPNLSLHALEELCFSELDGLEDLFHALVESSSKRIRALAVRGLGSLGTVRASNILRQLAADRSENDPLGRLAHRILQYPYRYGRVKLRSTRGTGR